MAEYRRALGRHVLPKLGSRKLDQVTRADVVDLIHSLASTPVAANRLRAVLSGMYGVAITMGWVSVNPCEGVTAYKERARQRFLTPAEQMAVIAHLDAQNDQRAADVVRLLMLTGARRGEVIRATWDMFDLDRGVWLKPSHHTKQDREHVVALPAAAVELLTRRKDAQAGTSDYVFPQRSNPQAPIVGIKRFWGKLQEAMGLDGLRIHDLRHTSASVLISAGHSMAEVGQVLGHTQSRTTERYAHLFEDNIRRSAETLGAAFKKSVVPTA